MKEARQGNANATDPGSPLYHYPGNIHVHSVYSDGTGTIGEITAAASLAGLSYVIVTDHETLAGLPEEGIVDGVLVLVGAEINREHSHYLALGIEELVEGDEENPQHVIDQVRLAGGLGFIAHPLEQGSPYIDCGKAYPWIHWPVYGFNGMEIWNYSSYCRGRYRSPLKGLYWFYMNRNAAVDSPQQECLALWDCYNMAGHRTVGIGGSDAHAFIYRLGLFRAVVFDYLFLFRAINTYVVLEEALSGALAEAKRQVIGALRDGRCFISFDGLSPGREFSFYALSGGRRTLMGGELAYRDDISLCVRSPLRRALMRIVGDGRVVAFTPGSELTWSPRGPGVYRAEVYYRPKFGAPRPWIYSNPIFITA